MIFYIGYAEDGYAVTEFNYERERKILLFSYRAHKACGTTCDIEWANYSTELGIDMIRLLVVERLVDPNDLRFMFKNKLLTIDSDAIFDVEGEDKSVVVEFISFSEKIARKMMKARSQNRRACVK